MSVIKNKEILATTMLRTQALEIVESGLVSIDTGARIRDIVHLENGLLTIGANTFPLHTYKSIHIIGFGKASSRAAQALEEVLGDTLTGGIVLDKTPLVCRLVSVYQGAHPEPTAHNVEISDKIATLAKSLTDDDLAIVVVSGGGSSLLCWPASECDQGSKLYEAFLHAGGTINELNMLRKHLSGMKGGGLAELLYPATVVGLIFCDVPGEHYDVVASGPTYYDQTTADQAQALLEKYGIKESFNFTETPKDQKFFEHVHNVPVVSNIHAMTAMAKKAAALGYTVHTIGSEVYDTPEKVIDKLLQAKTPNSVVIGAGEPRMVIPSTGGGLGGRNEYISSLMINSIPDDSVFVSYASDGIDNCSEAAGAIIDNEIKEKSKTLEKPIEDYLKNYQHDDLMIALGSQIITGSTESNVSDLFFLIQS